MNGELITGMTHTGLASLNNGEGIKESLPQKGDVFLCVRDVIMNDGEIDYLKGHFYKSEEEGSITDEEGYTLHHWTNNWTIYFKRLIARTPISL